MSEFEIQIKHTDFEKQHIINICLKCIHSSCKYIHDEIIKQDFFDPNENEDSNCLIQVSLTIEKQIQHAEFETLNDFQYKAELTDFYNNVHVHGLQDDSLQKKLKHGASALLALSLIEALQHNLLSKKDVILLEASGTIKDKDMIYLVEYYHKLGFHVLEPEMLRQRLDVLSVHMGGFVYKVINHCIQQPISHELNDILIQHISKLQHPNS